jgi:hypothetical protein
MKKLQSALIILIPLIGFIGILMLLNGYQYLRIRSDVAANIVTTIGTTETTELQNYIAGIVRELKLVREWGKNDVLISEDIVSLNKKFIPLLEQQKAFSAIIIANDQGQEYLLTKDGDSYLTRVSATTDKGNTLHYQKWSAADTSVRSWQESSQYDPKERPWFPKILGDDKVYWSGVYSFFQTKEPGVTASVSWETPGLPSRYTVFGVDIPLSGIKTILSQNSANRQGMLFLVAGDSDLFVAGTPDKKNPVLNITSDNENILYTDLIKQWHDIGKPAGELVKTTVDGQKWLAVFQNISNDTRTFWLGFTAPEKNLLHQIDGELYRVDLVDLIVAASGALLILLWMGKRGLLHRQAAAPPSPLTRLQECIRQGEGPGVEFKSTVRTNLQTGKRGKEIELAWLKAVSAFLNTEGGTLLLGVVDSGEICGIKADEFDSSDHCLLHVKNLLNQHIGAEFSGYIVTTIVDCPEGNVVMIECRPAGAAVFLKIGKNEEFYVRSGPSSTKLTPSQTVSYMAEKSR